MTLPRTNEQALVDTDSDTRQGQIIVIYEQWNMDRALRFNILAAILY